MNRLVQKTQVTTTMMIRTMENCFKVQIKRMLNCTLTGRGRNVDNERCLREITVVQERQ